MARATPHAASDDQGTTPQAGDWQALRGELVALLNQVEGRLDPVRQAAPPAARPAPRPRRLPDPAPHDLPADQRHREALRSVKKAMDRFAPEPLPEQEDDYDALPPNPRDILQSAILDIRSRHRAPRAAASPSRQPVQPPAPAPVLPEATARQFDEFARAVGTISGRLERLEAMIKAQSGAENIREIGEQMGQLTQVVELLAGAVGETGQVKRLEGQISGLARLVAEGPRLDFSALTERMDDVSSTVARLAELQIEQTTRDRARPSPAEAVREGMQGVEETLRAVYDRIDTMERNVALPPAALERLTDEVAEINAAMRAGAMQPAGLVEMIETLGQRLEAIDGRADEVTGLRDDVLALRGAVVSAIDPRFSALEMQIEALTDRVTDGPTDAGIGQLEAQVRLLAARMDQTGEQLTGLARLYTDAEPDEPALDIEALAERVANRTSEAIRDAAPEPVTPELGEDSLAALEARMSALFRAAAEEARGPAPDLFEGMQDGIRQVDERLARLEQSLSRLREPVAAPERHPSLPKDLLYVKVNTPPSPAAAFAEEDAGLDDAMPLSPDEERPLTDPGFPDFSHADPGPVRTALSGGRPMSTLRPGAADRPAFDPSSVTPPPRPQSSLELGTDIDFTPQRRPEPEPVHAPASETTVSRNTFIEAARRAAQRQNAQKTEANATSLIGRAMARFHQAGEADDGAEAPRARAAHPKSEPAPLAEAKAQEAAASASVEPQAVTPEDTADEAARPGFLSRHRQPLLLAASVVAIAFLTLNLIGQRNEEARLRETGAATATSTVPSALPAPANAAADLAEDPAGPRSDSGIVPAPAAVAGPARILPLTDGGTDGLVTGSIDPGAAMRFAPTTGQPPSDRFGSAGVAVTNAALGEPMPPLPVEPAVTGPTRGAVQVELPPEAVGPQGLREAAANGDPRAQFEVAAIYTEGRALPQDFAAAAIWYERAAAQGFAPAQYRLGNLYENGRGIEQDFAQARLWYQRAAEADNRMSMHNLAALLAGGQLGEQDFSAAAEWFEKAALRGLADSQFNLGMLYARGLGVPQNMEASYKWFSLAAAGNDPDAVKARDDVARSLDPDAVARVTAELAAWQPQQIDLAANFAPIGSWNAGFDPGEAITDQSVVTNVQAALGRLGYEIGEPDGIAGPRTAEAIRAFERATGMSEVGAINPRLLAVLGSQPV
ncbi:hypothetical protein EMQ25_00670 [Arsenicitalea aurantiaca]|uniref:Peptidoglycan binding-like domain-containing protein n=1 Tax=Arsenicitalea aurantiaca TaxID=1783274 RepID=A0A433XKA8_9HYPH|nr:peptidoglycan-binding protein [Arsenicitalea aurantiaca]RUT34511.1 hypothetical protein EMQ25_00670 [Arsenicitalea aurantiaca]